VIYERRNRKCIVSPLDVRFPEVAFSEVLDLDPAAQCMCRIHIPYTIDTILEHHPFSQIPDATGAPASIDTRPHEAIVGTLPKEGRKVPCPVLGLAPRGATMWLGKGKGQDVFSKEASHTVVG
jgi:hypothetical protein